MKRVALLLLPAFALSACDVLGLGKADDDGKPPVATATPTPVPSDTKPQALKVSEDTSLYSFDFAYPEEVAVIPELKERLDAAMQSSKAELVKQARAAQASARKAGFPYNAYAAGTEWKVVTNTPRFLSLSAAIYSYTGGAHSNSGSDTLVWDRETKRALEPLDFFTSAEALEQAVHDPFCAALDKERAKRRGADAGEVDGEFDDCPPIGDLTLLLGSTNGKTFNRIGLIADPYVAGPYAEGSYDITVPVTAELLEVVQPAYTDAFSLR